MDRPEFSEVLYLRRRELGLTIDQAARALRLKERVLVAFEEGDWDSMPKSGYAQGMLSSYARYLGLDTREVTQMFTRDLEEFQEMRGNDDARLRGPDSTNVVSTPGRRRGFSGARGLLPTSGGYAGDMEDFSSVSVVNGRGSYGSYGTAAPSAGVGTGYSQGSTPLAGGYGAAQAASDGRRYTQRQPTGATGRGRARTTGGSVRLDGYGSSREEAGQATRQARQRGGYRPRIPVEGDDSHGRTRSSRRDSVTTRRVSDGDYVDDLRYDDRAETYRAASTTSGRRGSRGIAAPERPNVRRQDRQRRPANDRSRGRGGSGGIFGRFADVLGGNAQLAFIIMVVAAVILTVIIISSVTSCISNVISDGRETPSTPQVEQEVGSTAKPADDAKQDADGSAAGDDAGSDAKDAADQTGAATTPQTSEPETKVEVTVAVADAGITWVEITVDGQTQVAETKTGPWSATYSVTRAMKIDVSEPSVVTVTRNGVTQSFDAKASGVGTLTIDGPADVPTDDDSSQSSSSTTEWEVLQWNDDGTWWDQNWNLHDGEGGYWDDDDVYRQE